MQLIEKVTKDKELEEKSKNEKEKNDKIKDKACIQITYGNDDMCQIGFEWDKSLPSTEIQKRLLYFLTFFSHNQQIYESLIIGLRNAGIRKNQLDLVNSVLMIWTAAIDEQEGNEMCVFPHQVFGEREINE